MCAFEHKGVKTQAKETFQPTASIARTPSNWVTPLSETAWQTSKGETPE